MKFLTALATILVAPGALSLAVSIPPPRSLRSSSRIAQRDISTATSVLASVKSGLGSLSDAAREFNGDAEPFKKAASGLLSTVESGTAVITKMTSLSTFDCLSLLSPAKELQKQGRALGDQLKAKKDVIQRYKQCGTTYGFLSRGVDDSAALITALVSKVPASFGGIVKGEGDKITQELKNAQDVFAPGNCLDA